MSEAIGGAGAGAVESNSSYAEVNQLSYLLRDMTFDAVGKFEKIMNLNVLSAKEKESLANQLQSYLNPSAFNFVDLYNNFSGINVNILV